MYGVIINMISISADYISSVEPFSPWLHISPQKPLHQLCSWKPAHTSNKIHTFNFMEMFNKVGSESSLTCFISIVTAENEQNTFNYQMTIIRSSHVTCLCGTNLPSVKSASPKVRWHMHCWAARPTMAPHLGHPQEAPLVHPQTTQTLPQSVETQICTVWKNW